MITDPTAVKPLHSLQAHQPNRLDHNQHLAFLVAPASTTRSYPDKIRVPDDEIQAVNLHGDAFHPGLNCTHQKDPKL